MSNIKRAFANGRALISFITAGDPSLAATENLISTMESAGADLVEIGIPFSDPVAEGEVIQRSNARALSAGTNVDKIFGMVRSARRRVKVPLVFLTYLNPVFSYGYDRFFEKCGETGIDGIIIPDLPYEEKGEILPSCNRCGVELISLIAPTSARRISKIAAEAKGFVYCVSSMGVTGTRNELDTGLRDIVLAAKASAAVPVAVGFGISTPEQAKEIGLFADGVIIGSAVVKIIERYGENSMIPVSDYIREIKTALR